MSTPIARLAPLVACIAALSTPEVLASDPKVKANQLLADLLAPKGGLAASPLQFQASAPPAAPAVPTSPGGLVMRVVFWTAGLALGAAALAASARFALARGKAIRQDASIRVVGRAALTHKHAVFVIEAAGKTIIVGVSGDRMTVLAEAGGAEQPAPAATTVEPRLESSRGFSVRPGDREAVLSARAIAESELAPYRKQMERLRGILRGFRAEGAGDGAAGGEVAAT